MSERLEEAEGGAEHQVSLKIIFFCTWKYRTKIEIKSFFLSEFKILKMKIWNLKLKYFEIKILNLNPLKDEPKTSEY